MNMQTIISALSGLSEGTRTSRQVIDQLKKESLELGTIWELVSVVNKGASAQEAIEFVGLSTPEPAKPAKRASKPAKKASEAKPASEASEAKPAKKASEAKPASEASEAKPAKRTKKEKKVYNASNFEFLETDYSYLLADTTFDDIEVVANDDGEPWGFKFGKSQNFTRIDRVEVILERASELAKLIELLS